MRLRAAFLFVCLLFISIKSAPAQNLVSGDPEIFRDAPRPVTMQTPFPENSGFVAINSSVFTTASSHNSEIFTITDFPLGKERVTLHVEQFDVLTPDSKIVLGTKNGDIPTDAPAHVLLHGTVEGKNNSYVYIAIFDGYAMGYIDASENERYLVQPVSMKSEGASTMIVYKQNDVVRPVPADDKWYCGAESFPPNFPNIARITNEMATAHHVPEIQAQKTVRFLSIALDCDFKYYKANGYDKTKAQNYAIALLGAHSDIYVRDLGCGVTAGFLRVWTTKDTYSDNGDSTDNQLPTFMDYWNNNGGLSYASALMYTTVVNGGMAYIGTLCNANGENNNYGVCGLNTGYTFPQDGYIWDVYVSTHEFGHTCGSFHTHNCSWNPAIDSCVAAEGGSCYATPHPTKGTIMSYCHQTPLGIDLKFHPRTITFLKDRLNNSATVPCASTVQLPVANAGPNVSLCLGNSITLGAHSPGGTAPFTYSWRPSTNLSSTTTETVKAFPTKTMTYITTVTDRNMLRSYDTVLVTIIKATIPTITKNKDSIFSSAGSSYQWYLESVVIPGATNKKYVPLKSGNYTVRTTSANGCDSISKPFAFTLSTSGVDETDLRSHVRIYPNPATNQLTFDYSAAGEVPLELTVSDALGNAVFHSSRKRGESNAPLVIDISSFAQGSYFVRFSFGEGHSTLKFVKE